MIQFRCWYCNRLHGRPEAKAGETFRCACECLLRVPRQSGGKCRVYTFVDWLVEGVVYGGGGALLGFGLALVILAKLMRGVTFTTWAAEAGFLVGLTLMGFVAGLFLGERGVNWVGRKIRGSEDLPR
jgi:hypothetical protein